MNIANDASPTTYALPMPVLDIPTSQAAGTAKGRLPHTLRSSADQSPPASRLESGPVVKDQAVDAIPSMDIRH